MGEGKHQPLSRHELSLHVGRFVNDIEMTGRLDSGARPYLLAPPLVDYEVSDEPVEISARINDGLAAGTGEAQTGFLHDIFGRCGIAKLPRCIRPEFAVIRIDER